MKKIVLLLALLGLVSSTGYAASTDELNRDEEIAQQELLHKDLPKTVVMRVNTETNAVEVMHSMEALEATASTEAELEGITGSNFVAMNPQTDRHQLDTDTSKSSFYFYYRNPWAHRYYRGYNYGWGYPNYYYGGYNYTYFPYYAYSYRNWSYYYCRWY